MKTNRLHIIPIIIILLATGLTSCNNKEYCDFSAWKVSTALHYDWSGVTSSSIPSSLNNTLTGAKDSSFVSTAEWSLFKPVDGSYSLFAWNNAENVTVQDEMISVAKNADGSLKSTGELFTGKTTFSISNAVSYDLEKGNTHYWNDPPFHHGSSIIIDTVEVKMKAQSRVLKVFIKVKSEEDLIQITKMTGSVTGLASARNSSDTSQGVTDGYANLTFTKVNDSIYVASISVIGADNASTQNVSLNVTFSDGSSTQTEANVSNEMSDFNTNLGNKEKDLELSVSVAKARVGYTAVITDWKTIDGGTIDIPY